YRTAGRVARSRPTVYTRRTRSQAAPVRSGRARQRSGAVRLATRAAPARSGQQRVAVVALDHAYDAVGSGVQAQAAQDALVDVLLDDLQTAVAGGEDVDGAGVSEPTCELGVLGCGVVDLDGDEDAFGPHAPALAPSFSPIIVGMSSIR